MNFKLWCLNNWFIVVVFCINSKLIMVLIIVYRFNCCWLRGIINLSNMVKIIIGKSWLMFINKLVISIIYFCSYNCFLGCIRWKFVKKVIMVRV